MIAAIAPSVPLDEQNGSHPITAGKAVAVIKASPVGQAHIEGWATIIAPAAGEHCYLIHFAGDPVVRERFIHPDWQADPERALRRLQQLWRAEAGPDIADFFPEDI